jgi:hypothetical protein
MTEFVLVALPLLVVALFVMIILTGGAMSKYDHDDLDIDE